MMNKITNNHNPATEALMGNPSVQTSAENTEEFAAQLEQQVQAESTELQVGAAKVDSAKSGTVAKPGAKLGKEAEETAAQLAQSAQLAQGVTMSQIAPQLSSAPIAREITGEKNGVQALAEHARKSELRQANELSPLTMKTAASVNTGTAIAGLKPWSKDWVFEGVDPNANLEPLFPSAPKAGSAEIKAAPQVKNPQSTNPQAAGAAQGSLNADSLLALLTGGELNSALNSENGAVQMAALKADHSAPEAALHQKGSVDSAGLMLPEMEVQSAKSTSQVVPAQNAISGGEFLSTLNQVRGVQSQNSGSSAGGNGQQSMNSKPDLKLVPGGKESVKGKKLQGALEAGIASELASSRLNHASQPQANPSQLNVTGHVTKGAMAEDRLSSEALGGVSAGIRNLSTHGGGEMRIRLRPENLGELHVRVVTSGNDVGLQIQASDERAKRIIEESIGHLKESLASQNLTLGKVDLSVAQVAAGSSMGQDQGHGTRQDHSANSSNPQSFSNLMSHDQRNGSAGQGHRESGGRVDLDSSGGSTRRVASAGSAAALASAGARRSIDGAGRIDVRA